MKKHAKIYSTILFFMGISIGLGLSLSSSAVKADCVEILDCVDIEENDCADCAGLCWPHWENVGDPDDQYDENDGPWESSDLTYSGTAQVCSQYQECKRGALCGTFKYVCEPNEEAMWHSWIWGHDSIQHGTSCS